MRKSIIRTVKSIGYDQPVLQTRRTDTQRLASLPTDASLALQEAIPAAFDKQLDKLAIWLTPHFVDGIPSALNTLYVYTV